MFFGSQSRFSKIELVLLFGIIITGFFVLAPFYNSFSMMMLGDTKTESSSIQSEREKTKFDQNRSKFEE